MIPDPLHPAIVHFPIVLTTLLPLAIAWALWRGRKGKVVSAWIPVLALSLLLAGAATFALETGEDEEEVVEDVVGEDVIEVHEEAAELFQRSTFGVLILVALGMIPAFKDWIGRSLRIAALVGSLVLVPLMLRTGESGGDLVWKHGAASAYSGSAHPAPRASHEEEDDD